MKYYDMMQYARPAGSKKERRFIKRFIDSVEGMEADAYGNRYIVIGENPTTMFSSHTDTVHRQQGTQKLQLDEDMGLLHVIKNDCLGADDGTGIFIMLNMIDAGVNGLYVFHREEECGGGGGIYFEANMIKHWPEVKHCIAFDRKGYSSVITHQMGLRTASEEFANALCLELGVSWKPDDTGSFTDSESYSETISECTNVSVGYFNQHTPQEYQDVFFMEELIGKLINIDWGTLPACRDPNILEYDDWGQNLWPKKDEYATVTGAANRVDNYAASYLKQANGDNWEFDWDVLPSTEAEVDDLLYSDPPAAADLICHLLGIRG